MARRHDLKRLHARIAPLLAVPVDIRWAEDAAVYHIVRYQQLDGRWHALYLNDGDLALWLHALGLAAQWGTGGRQEAARELPPSGEPC